MLTQNYLHSGLKPMLPESYLINISLLTHDKMMKFCKDTYIHVSFYLAKYDCFTERKHQKKQKKWKFNASAPMFLLGLNLLDISEIAPRLFIVYLVNENFVVT